MLPSLKKQILSRRLKQGQTMLTKRTQMANMEFSNRVAQASQLEEKQGYSARCAEASNQVNSQIQSLFTQTAQDFKQLSSTLSKVLPKVDEDNILESGRCL